MSKTKACLLVGVFKVPTAKNLKVVGPWPARATQGRLKKTMLCQSSHIKNFPLLYQLRGWICCLFLELNSYLSSRIQFHQLH